MPNSPACRVAERLPTGASSIATMATPIATCQPSTATPWPSCHRGPGRGTGHRARQYAVARPTSTARTYATGSPMRTPSGRSSEGRPGTAPHPACPGCAPAGRRSRARRRGRSGSRRELLGLQQLPVPGRRADPRLGGGDPDVPERGVRVVDVDEVLRVGRRSFSIGSRLWHPAISRASSPSRSCSPIAGSTLVARPYSMGAGTCTTPSLRGRPIRRGGISRPARCS